MAKKKAGGTSIGLILTLIFFILATFITGTVAYFGYADQEQYKKDIETAKSDKATATAKFREERVRKALLRIAMGIDAPNKKEQEADSDSDRLLLVSEMEAFRPQIKEEYDRLLRVLDEKLPDKNAFVWKLLTMKSEDVNAKAAVADARSVAGDPDVAPVKSLPAMLQFYKDEMLKARAAQQQAEKKSKTDEERAKTAEDLRTKDKETYDASVAMIRAQEAMNKAKSDADFKALAAKHMNDAKTPTDRAAALGTQVAAKDDEINKLNDKITDLTNKVKKYEAINAGQAAVGVDFLNLEEKKGQILRREENGFVTVNIGSTKKVKPQITFLVVSSDISWLALLEKEESLKKNSTRNDRQPFEDNPYVKAGIEIVEVTGPETSRAKILFENEPIRNPIQVRDQIFNLAWQPNEEIRIAFAGIIDLDGDGLDNNDDFLRILERQGVIVDEYLKLKPLEFVKRDNRGITLRTKYLVIAPDPRLDALPIDRNTPQTEQIKATIEKMSEIKSRAREMGVQLIEARKFLAMIGYKLPKNPVPPAYGAAVYLDQSAAPPPAEPKKNER